MKNFLPETFGGNRTNNIHTRSNDKRDIVMVLEHSNLSIYSAWHFYWNWEKKRTDRLIKGFMRPQAILSQREIIIPLSTKSAILTVEPMFWTLKCILNIYIKIVILLS